MLREEKISECFPFEFGEEGEPPFELRPVGKQDIKKWRANCLAIVGKYFICKATLPKKFAVTDFVTKEIKGLHYDVLYQGDELEQTVGEDELFETLSTSEEVLYTVSD